jgi:hypothetical protein
MKFVACTCECVSAIIFVDELQNQMCLIMTWNLHGSAEGHWKDFSMTGQLCVG